MAGWQGEQGLTWVQRRLLWGHLVTVQLTLTLKETQPDVQLTTRYRPAATTQALILLGASCTLHRLSLTCSLLYVVSTKDMHQPYGMPTAHQH